MKKSILFSIEQPFLLLLISIICISDLIEFFLFPLFNENIADDLGLDIVRDGLNNNAR